MSISVSSARRAAVGAVGAGVVAGGLLLFGAVGPAQAEPAPASVSGPMSTTIPAYLHNQPDVAPVVSTGLDSAPIPDWWHRRWFHPLWWW
jgi:hypothetical protein